MACIILTGDTQGMPGRDPSQARFAQMLPPPYVRAQPVTTPGSSAITSLTRDVTPICETPTPSPEQVTHAQGLGAGTRPLGARLAVPPGNPPRSSVSSVHGLPWLSQPPPRQML